MTPLSIKREKGSPITPKIALLIIDAQVNMFAEAMPVHNPTRLLETISALAERARRRRLPVIYVRNNGGENDPDRPGSPGWEIHPALAPQEGEVIIDKRTPDAFAGTGLRALLQAQGIEELVLGGRAQHLRLRGSGGGRDDRPAQRRLDPAGYGQAGRSDRAGIS